MYQNYLTYIMKLFLILFLLPSLLKAQVKFKTKFELIGSLNNIENRFIYFVTYDNNDIRNLDSTFIKDGAFKYFGKLNGYLFKFFIKLNPNDFNNNDSLNNVRVPIENAKMKIKLELGKFSKYELVGCKSCQIIKTFDSINKVRYDINLLHDSILNEPNTNSGVKRRLKINDSIKRVNFYKKWLSYCQNNLKENASTYILYELLHSNILKKVKSIASNLNFVQKNSYYGTKLRSAIKSIEKDIIEEKMSNTKLLKTQAYKFKSEAFGGNIITLEETYKKGYTILDFWASWCGPCRKSHPAFINISNKYSKSNFNIIGISVDENIEDWKIALMKDSITIWPNILDTKKKNGLNLAKKYNINYYPTKVLIDKKGIIVGIYIGEDFTELEKKLKEIFNY